jgi:non-specific serine/threonine protein kinase
VTHGCRTRLVAVLVTALLAAAAGPAAAAPAWDVLPALPTARTEVAAAAVADEVWVLGGFGTGTDAVAGSHTVDVFDTESQTWRPGPDLPLPLHHAALVALGPQLVVLGGYTGKDLAATSLAWTLDTSAAMPVWTPFLPLPLPRAAHATATDGERIWVFGGSAGSGQLATETFVYESGIWQPVTNFPAPREYLGGAYLDGKVYAIGGRVGSLESNTGRVDVFDPATGQWSTGPELPTPRGGLAAATLGDRIVVVGGEGVRGTFATAEALNLSGVWTSLPPMPTARHGLGAAAVGDGVHVLAGGPRPGLTFSGAHERLQL